MPHCCNRYTSIERMQGLFHKRNDQSDTKMFMKFNSTCQVHGWVMNPQPQTLSVECAFIEITSAIIHYIWQALKISTSVSWVGQWCRSIWWFDVFLFVDVTSVLTSCDFVYCCVCPHRCSGTGAKCNSGSKPKTHCGDKYRWNSIRVETISRTNLKIFIVCSHIL